VATQCGSHLSGEGCEWGTAAAENETRERSFLISGLLSADCFRIALEVFPCPSRLPVADLTTRKDFFVPVKSSEQGKVLFIAALA